MKIYTKGGDKGQTSLYGGKRVSKSDLRIETYGTVDELNAHLGVLRDRNEEEQTETVLLRIQHCLFTIGAELAADPEQAHKLKMPRISDADVQALEEEIDRITDQLEPMRFFILPGGDLSSSYAHIARTVCRRAERRVIALQDDEQNVDPRIVEYLNRLSDYLFTLSRWFTKQNKGVETPWKTS